MRCASSATALTVRFATGETRTGIVPARSSRRGHPTPDDPTDDDPRQEPRGDGPVSLVRCGSEGDEDTRNGQLPPAEVIVPGDGNGRIDRHHRGGHVWHEIDERSEERGRDGDDQSAGGEGTGSAQGRRRNEREERPDRHRRLQDREARRPRGTPGERGMDRVDEGPQDHRFPACTEGPGRLPGRCSHRAAACYPPWRRASCRLGCSCSCARKWNRQPSGPSARTMHRQMPGQAGSPPMPTVARWTVSKAASCAREDGGHYALHLFLPRPLSPSKGRSEPRFDVTPAAAASSSPGFRCRVSTSTDASLPVFASVRSDPL